MRGLRSASLSFLPIHHHKRGSGFCRKCLSFQCGVITEYMVMGNLTEYIVPCGGNWQQLSRSLHFWVDCRRGVNGSWMPCGGSRYLNAAEVGWTFKDGPSRSSCRAYNILSRNSVGSLFNFGWFRTCSSEVSLLLWISSDRQMPSESGRFSSFLHFSSLFPLWRWDNCCPLTFVACVISVTLVAIYLRTFRRPIWRLCHKEREEWSELKEFLVSIVINLVAN